jgi:hypothetical protein
MPKLAPIKTSIFEKFLVYVGCTLEDRAHQTKRKGGHKKYVRADLSRPVIIQAKPEIPEMVIKSNLRTLGISTADYLAILEQI